MHTAHPHANAAPFWDRTASKYARKPIADPAAYEAKLAHVQAFLQPEDRVLEIGCGTGSTTLRLAGSVAEITATDISREMIAIADRKRAQAKVANVTFRQAAADERLAEAPFDVVAAFSLLHLVEDVPAVLDAVYAQTRPGGLFISKTVCLGDTHFGLRLFVRALCLLGVAPPVTMLGRAGVSRALIDAGFEVVECRYFGKGRLNPFIVARRPV